MRRLLPFLALSLLFLPVLAEDAVEPQDEIVREVIRLLEAEVHEEVIFTWLDRDQRAPEKLSADDVIALTRAGASRKLMDRLMAPKPEPRAPKTGSSMSDAEFRETMGDLQKTSPMGRIVLPDEIGTPVGFSVRYRPFRDAEADDEEQWQLFLYLDGRPLAWAEGKNWLKKSKRQLEFTANLSPGMHTLRLAQERHYKRGKAWFHEARVCPEPIEFDATPGRTVEIEIAEPVGLSLKGKRIYRWAVLQDGTPHSEREIAGPLESWPPLCEEIEINYVGKKNLPRHARKDLERCTRWDDLWLGLDDVPLRSAVREELSASRFRPPAPGRPTE